MGGTLGQAAAGIRAQSLARQRDESLLGEATGSQLAVPRREPRAQTEAPQPESQEPSPLDSQAHPSSHIGYFSPLHQTQENVNI